MYINIHIFVFIATIIFYFLLYNLTYEKNRQQKKLNLIYILFIPIILYFCYYYYAENELLFSYLYEPIHIKPINNTTISSHNTEYMNMPFPHSSDSSFF
jgi:membrane-associated HD superfamily phosphohydrolase